MTSVEFENQFDVYYNNITSNQAPGLNTYEKSVFLTRAEFEIVKNHFSANSKGNNLGQGFDDSAKRQADFSSLMKTAECSLCPDIRTKYTCTSEGETKVLYDDDITFTNGGNPYPMELGMYEVTNGEIRIEDPYEPAIAITVTVTEFPFTNGTLVIAEEQVNNKIDDRSLVYKFPTDVFIAINETIKTTNSAYLQVIPLRYDEYTRLMSKPFKRPLKNQAWRLINSGEIGDTGNYSNKKVEIITNAGDTISEGGYKVRYIRTPKPIIIGNLDGLTINGYTFTGTVGDVYPETEGCELDPILHDEILQRAVELAKVAWTMAGQDNTEATLVTGQRSE